MATITVKPQYTFRNVTETSQFVGNMDFLILRDSLPESEVVLIVDSMKAGDSIYVANMQSSVNSLVTLEIQGGAFQNTETENFPTLTLQRSEQVLLICKDPSTKRFTFSA